ncbi:hypothetical protein T439DRAFT_359447 [Meredithblackwellia eburnea MCA 4105]
MAGRLRLPDPSDEVAKKIQEQVEKRAKDIEAAVEDHRWIKAFVDFAGELHGSLQGTAGYPFERADQLETYINRPKNTAAVARWRRKKHQAGVDKFFGNQEMWEAEFKGLNLTRRDFLSVRKRCNEAASDNGVIFGDEDHLKNGRFYSLYMFVALNLAHVKQLRDGLSLHLADTGPHLKWSMLNASLRRKNSATIPEPEVSKQAGFPLVSPPSSSIRRHHTTHGDSAAAPKGPEAPKTTRVPRTNPPVFPPLTTTATILPPHTERASPSTFDFNSPLPPLPLLQQKSVPTFVTGQVPMSSMPFRNSHEIPEPTSADPVNDPPQQAPRRPLTQSDASFQTLPKIRDVFPTLANQAVPSWPVRPLHQAPAPATYTGLANQPHHGEVITTEPYEQRNSGSQTLPSIQHVLPNLVQRPVTSWRGLGHNDGQQFELSRFFPRKRRNLRAMVFTPV